MAVMIVLLIVLSGIGSLGSLVVSPAELVERKPAFVTSSTTLISVALNVLRRRT